MFFTDSVIGDLFGVLVALVIVIVSYYKWNFSYWRRRNIPYLEPSIPFGNIPNPLRKIETLGVSMKRRYEEMKSKGWKHGGLYPMATPNFMVIDLELVKNIMAKDFQYFTDRGFYYNEKDDPLSANMFAIGGTKWRNLRTKLSPTFTSGKMKMMFQTLLDCECNLQKKMLLVLKKKEPIDIKEILGCFTTDIIGSCAFGLDCNTFKEDNSPFRVYGKKAFILSTFRNFLLAFAFNFPNAARFLGMGFFDKELTDFFYKIVVDTVNYREKNNYSRKDFMQLLIDLKNNKLTEDDGDKHDGNTLTITEIAAQSLLFFIAGFETSSTTMTFALYELAKNQHIQDKLRDEIGTILAKYDGTITYEAVQDMKYMDHVIDETLRKYPPAPLINRLCVKDYKVPDSDVVIEKGTTIAIPVLGIHYDKEHYPDPDKFDPERFNDENSRLRHQYAHLPFGEGPRICIGMRFGLMQTKVGLTSLLRKYKFTLNKKTKEPIKFHPNSFVLSAEGDIWLDAQKL